MSALALQLPLAAELERPESVGAPPADPGGEPSLDSVLAGLWEGLAAHRSVPCPLCGGEMRPQCDTSGRRQDGPGAPGRGQAGHRAGRTSHGGRCESCQTRLS